MRLLAIFLGITLLAGLMSCSTEHGDLVTSFPVLPEITEARLSEGADQVSLSWTFADSDLMDDDDVYNIYYGWRVQLGFGAFDTLRFVGSTEDMEFVYENEALAEPDPILCDQLDICVPVYEFSYFRVSAVIDGEESVGSPKVFPDF